MLPRPSQVPFLAWICFAGALSMAPSVRADSGSGYGFGPVFALSADDTFSMGWELGASASVLAKASVGGTYYLKPRRDEPAFVHYAAFEPWLLLGGTLGVAVTHVLEPRLAYGLWEGIPVPLSGALLDDPDDAGGQTIWMATLTIGWRGFGSTHQFYFTPKLWRYRGFDLFN
jgi:hypothetical protein